jgi:hypothetical protein
MIGLLFLLIEGGRMKAATIAGRTALVAAAIAVGLGAGAAPAAASATNTSSTTFAGYSAAVTGAVTVTTNFKLEAITCTATSQGIAPGIVLSGSTSVAAATINESCASGTPAYSAVAVINGATTTLAVTVAPGDKISMTVAVSTTGTTVQISDVTAHTAKKAVGAGGAPSSLFVGSTALYQGSTLMGVPTFVSEGFNDTKVNGAALSTTNPAAVDRVSSTNVAQIKTGKLNTTGVRFKETFKSH